MDAVTTADKEGDNRQTNTALATQVKRLGATDRSDRAEDSILPPVYQKRMTMEKAPAKYKEVVEEIEEELVEFQETEEGAR